MNPVEAKWSRDARHRLIPGGAHTYSRGDDQYPQIAPSILSRGKGAHVWTPDGERYLDWGMGLRSVILGYADDEVDEAAFLAAREGINLSRVTPDELELASLLTEAIPGAEMVKFGKNGSDATAGAVRLARAVTGRDVILRCANNPFLGVHDWFIGSTVMRRGIPSAVQDLTRTFRYNDIEDLLLQLDENRDKVAAVILEPVGFEEPLPGYLEAVQQATREAGALLIFDETITGFRLNVGGAQERYGVIPDLSTFGKALANGYPLSALVGKREFMELGGIDHDTDRIFLMSSTYGAERVSLAAAGVTVRRLLTTDVLEANEVHARNLMSGFRSLVAEHGLGDRIQTSGLDLLPLVLFTDLHGQDDYVLKTVLLQEMVRHHILLPQYFLSMSSAHRGTEISETLHALDSSLTSISVWLDRGSLREQLIGRAVSPVFRRRNHVER